MVDVATRFLFGIEEELFTSVLDEPAGERTEEAVRHFFHYYRKLAPSLPGPAGVFNGYGRGYPDVGHIELATAEADSVHALVQMIEQQHALAAQAAQMVARDTGLKLLLANITHNGIVDPLCPVFAFHENQWVLTNPNLFGELIVPFFITRIYAGAGAIDHGGNYLASARAHRMELTTGGNTTGSRAIHSTARQEHHLGPGLGYRYHILMGDGHRSQFNLALHVGVTAIVLRAIVEAPSFPREFSALNCMPLNNSWVDTLKKFNTLASYGGRLRIDPMVLAVQNLYYDVASRWVDARSDAPDWVPWVMQAWRQTLDALTTMDIPWLAARLDAFAKHEVFSAALDAQGQTWLDARPQSPVLNELALLDHSYHTIGDGNSVFERLDSAGLLAHRIVEVPEPGGESEPFVPPVSTRAKARALFIREHGHRDDLTIDWAYVHQPQAFTFRQLREPFAEQFGPWESNAQPEVVPPARPVLAQWREMRDQVMHQYQLGNFAAADAVLRRMDALRTSATDSRLLAMLRQRSWIRAQLGHLDGRVALDQLYPAERRQVDFEAITDYACVFRFQGLVPSAEIWQWLDRGKEVLARCSSLAEEPPSAAAFRDHLAYALVKSNRLDEAQDVCTLALHPDCFRRTSERIQGRLLALQAEVLRLQGKRRRAIQTLNEARHLMLSHRWLGDYARYVIGTEAKLYRTRGFGSRLKMVAGRLHVARAIQTEFRDMMGLFRTVALASRIVLDVRQNARNYDHLLMLWTETPALTNCPLACQILEEWQLWTTGQSPRGAFDSFWGL